MIKKNILIISATSKNNLELAKKIQSIIDTSIVDSEVLNLDKHCLPIFTEIFFHKNKNSYLLEAKFITDKFVNADGIIICAPEYNGSIPPIVSNTIAWISMSTEYWRDGFNNKVGLLCSHSGGQATKFIASMKLQLEHLGMTILPRNIVVNTSKKFNIDSSKKILKQFIKLL